MTRIILGAALALAATPAFAITPPVPEMDGGLALVVGAAVIGLAAYGYERFFRK